MSEWVTVCARDELPAGDFRVVDVDGVDVLVYNVAGDYFAIEDLCTHDGGELSGGPLDGCEVICPRHGARFCLKTGAALTPPAFEPVDTFPVRCHAGDIQVRDDRWD